MPNAPAVSVIIPTKALPERAWLLKRALESVLTQASVRVTPILVVNGPGADPHLVRDLGADRRVCVTTLERSHLPSALRAGRDLVDTPFFAELDDDDLLLPGALSVRVQALEREPECDAVVTNGYRRDESGDVLHVEDAAAVDRDPARALVGLNWLLPGSWLCRTQAVGSWIFEGMPQYFECTYFALQLATRCRMRFLERPTVVWNTDTPHAMSRSREYQINEVPALHRILELEMPIEVRAAFRAKLAWAYHATAALRLREGALADAWRWHFHSLRGGGGWRFLSFTRHLLLAPWRT
jgi:hypothetical protein